MDSSLTLGHRGEGEGGGRHGAAKAAGVDLPVHGAIDSTACEEAATYAI